MSLLVIQERIGRWWMKLSGFRFGWQLLEYISPKAYVIPRPRMIYSLKPRHRNLRPVRIENEYVAALTQRDLKLAAKRHLGCQLLRLSAWEKIQSEPREEHQQDQKKPARRNDGDQ